MTYFIHLHGSGPAPQSGYARVSRYRNPDNGNIWVLWSTDLTPAEIRTAISGTLYIVGDDTDANILTVYPDMIAQKRTRIRAKGAVMLTDVAGEYCAEERETWAQQQSEAEIYQATQDPDKCPMLAVFAAERGIDLPLLAAGILENAAAFKIASGQVMGQMYALLDQVNSAGSLSAALTIDWS